MNYRRATSSEGDGSCLQGYVLATYSELVQLFGEPKTSSSTKTLASWGIHFDDGTFASIYLWNMPSIPQDTHKWNVGGRSPLALKHVTDAVNDVPLVDTTVSPRRSERPPWTRKEAALSRACLAGDCVAIEVIIAAGADVNSRSPENDGDNTPLEVAIEGGCIDVIRTLLAVGSDVNARRPGGMTPLHKAAALADESIIQLLLDAGADTLATDNFGTPADWARRFGRGDIADFIDSRSESC